MKYCKNCHLKFDTPLKRCLFCNNDLENLDQENPQYKFRIYVSTKKTFPFLYKIVRFLLLVCALICIFIDYQNDKFLSWSLISLVASVYGIFLYAIIYKNSSWISKTLNSIILSSVAVILLGVCIRNYSWAIDYVFPCAIIFDTLFVSFVLVLNKRSYFDYSYYLFVFGILSIVPLLLVLFNVCNVTWPSIACFCYGLTTLIGTFYLSFQHSKEELKRRFHI